MISKRLAKVVSIKSENEEIQDLVVEIDSKESRAYNYVAMTGHADIGDCVVVNTTAVELSLGTGGFHYVILNMDKPESNLTPGGHIMKLRYTPLQIKVDSVEEQASPYHDVFAGFESLDSLPVAVGALHSILQPFAATYKKFKPDAKLVYIMTDGAALPISFSKNVENLKKAGLIDKTITYGNAFGGDYECINIYTALITAKEICKADCVLVAMGPGIAGTGTKYGFSGMDQATILDAVSKLGGRSYMIPRISFADKRDRHRGLSHHTLTILKDIVNNPTRIIINKAYQDDKLARIKEQLEENDLYTSHQIIEYDYQDTKLDLDSNNIRVKSMGRSFDEDREFFEAASAVAAYMGKEE